MSVSRKTIEELEAMVMDYQHRAQHAELQADAIRQTIKILRAADRQLAGPLTAKAPVNATPAAQPVGPPVAPVAPSDAGHQGPVAVKLNGPPPAKRRALKPGMLDERDERVFTNRYGRTPAKDVEAAAGVLDLRGRSEANQGLALESALMKMKPGEEFIIRPKRKSINGVSRMINRLRAAGRIDKRITAMRDQNTGQCRVVFMREVGASSP